MPKRARAQANKRFISSLAALLSLSAILVLSSPTALAAFSKPSTSVSSHF